MVIFHSYVSLPEGNRGWWSLPSGVSVACWQITHLALHLAQGFPSHLWCHQKVLSKWFSHYPLVNIQKAIENGPVEIVDLPTKNGGSFHSYVNVYQGVYPRQDSIKASILGPLGPSGPLRPSGPLGWKGSPSHSVPSEGQRISICIGCLRGQANHDVSMYFLAIKNNNFRGISWHIRYIPFSYELMW